MNNRKYNKKRTKVSPIRRMGRDGDRDGTMWRSRQRGRSGGFSEEQEKEGEETEGIVLD